MAARPKTLYAAVAPVLVGSAVAYSAGGFQILPALAALLAAVSIQIGTNLANDVADFRRGADNEARLGPVRVTQAGVLTERQVFSGMWLSFGFAALLGIYLYLEAGWPVLAIGLLSIAAGIAYTAGPFPLGYHGLGDAAVFVFFGLIAVNGTFYVQTRTLVPAVLWASLPIGLLATAIIVVNNLRDIDTDAAAGKITLAVRIGRRGTRLEFAVLLGLAFLIPLLMWALGVSRMWVLLPWLASPFALQAVQEVHQLTGSALNRTLASTSRLELLYSLLLSLGLILT